MCVQQPSRFSLKAIFSNWNNSRAPFLQKINLAVKNNLIKLRLGQRCCGNYGEEGKHILVVRLRQNYSAATGQCPHLGCLLANGTLVGNIITCPCHGSSFDVTDGHLVSWISKWPKVISVITKKIGMARSLKTYRVEVRREDVFIDL